MLFCIAEYTSGPLCSHALISLLSFLNIPSPEQGASIRTLSKNTVHLPDILAGPSLSTQRLEIPDTSTFLSSALVLELLMSLVIRSHVPLSFAARYVEILPGAAHISNTTSPSSIGSTLAGVIALGS